MITVIKRKALKAYDSFSIADARNYDTLKSAVLRADELRPEAYRQRFRSCKKRPHETFAEFSRTLVDNFNMWIRSERVYEDFERLSELVILENFMGNLDTDLHIYLADKGVKTPAEAAVFADDYYLVEDRVFT